MKHKLLVIIFLSLIHSFVLAQNNLVIKVKDAQTKEVLPGANVYISGTGIGTSSNKYGIADLLAIPNGPQEIIISFISYQKTEIKLYFPLKKDTLDVFLKPNDLNLGEIVVSSTRTNSRIEDLPQKIEVLGPEEVNEENQILPGNLTRFLGDLSVIHVQPISPISGDMTLRMQGLAGKYTQILRDGMPIYAGFSGGFGILQVPPLDLKQAEIIKGTSSTLYGGDAIAGLINLISKEPSGETELAFTLNQTSLKETNFNSYYSTKDGNIGLTLFAGATNQKAVDLNKDGISDSPDLKYYIFHPKIFFYLSHKTTLNIGIAATYENRLGGDMQVLNYKADSIHRFFENNRSQRYIADFNFTTKQSNNQAVTIKGATSLFNRNINYFDTIFNGQQINSFVEASYYKKNNNNIFIIGANFTGEKFIKLQSDSAFINDFYNQTTGIFIQDDWKIWEKFTFQAGFRSDFHNKFGNFYLPRLAILYKPVHAISFRFTAGTGYKTPNVFTQNTMSDNLNLILPVSENMKSETAYGYNFDFGYKKVLADYLFITFEQSFYYTKIFNPIIGQTYLNNSIDLNNSTIPIQSIGADSYLRVRWNEFEAYLGYNHTIAKTREQKPQYLPFSPQDKFGSILVYDIENTFEIGFEYGYIANQYIENNIKVKNYSIAAVMIKKQIRNFTFVLNCENLFDVKQSNYGPMFTGNISNPTFASLWAPVTGRVFNFAIAYKFTE